MNNLSTKKWISLSIDLDQKEKINILYQKFYDYIVGTVENNNKLIFYFDYEAKNIINSFSDNSFIYNEIKYQNWHEEYEKYFKPIKVDNQMIIIPDWFKITNNADKSINYIRIKPGMAFGTGNHETTQLILSQIKKSINQDSQILDLGSGSGILSIAAIKYGAKHVTCLEYDRDCEDNFFYNMKLNNISTGYTLLFKDVLSITDFDYDFIVANINKKIIIQLLPNIKKFRTKKCKVILSGLLKNDENELLNLINQLGFYFIESTTKGEWVCLVIE